MCGIAGYFLHPDFGPETAGKMIQRIKHRGPDFTGYFSDEIVSLAHARLSIIDLSSSGNQPFHSADRRYVMVYNGEVYNFRELADKMNYRPKTQSDTEVVIEAFAKYGPSFVDHLNGMFAIAIYDRFTGELNLLRDRFGIKPLYYYFDGSRFAFASELKALMEIPVQKELNREALNDYLFLEYIPQPKTILKNFFKLGNGQYLNIRGNSMKISTWYDILQKVNVRDTGEKKALEDFETLFDNSIRYRLIADVKVGAFLSGGADSSAVCAAMARQTDKTSSYNIGFDNNEYDESAYAAMVAGKLHLEHHHYRLKPADLLQDFEKIFDQYDEPFAVSSVFPTYKVCSLAKKDITVALSGDGGDELFMGYGHYNWYRRLQNLNNPAGKNLRYFGSALLHNMPSRFARISALLKYDSLKTDWPHVWSQEQYMFSRPEINRLTSQSDISIPLTNNWLEIQKRTNNPMLQLSLFDLKNYLADDLLYKVDMASMANSLEVRLPFLDHHLVEYLINIPSSLKYKAGNQKYLLKKYLEKSLPKPLIYRKKWGFGAPVDVWLKDDLRPLTEKYLSNSRLKSEGNFEPAEVQRLLSAFNNGQNFLYKRIWALMVFEIWLEKFYKN